MRKALLATEALLAACVLRVGVKVGDFEPEKYRREIVENADFRGYDDGLRMTIDCSVERSDRLERCCNRRARPASPATGWRC